MTQFSMLWETQTGTGDGVTSYTQEQSNNYFRYFDVQDPSTQGVAINGGGLNLLEVTGTSMPLDVDSGAAICWLRYWNDAATTVTVAAPVADTGGRVVLITDWATNTTRLAVVLSTVGVTTPPAIVQTIGAEWQLSLATFVVDNAGNVWTDASKTVAGVVDTRIFMKSVRRVGRENVEDDAIGPDQLAVDAVTNPETRNFIERIELLSDGPATALSLSAIPQTYKDLEFVFRIAAASSSAATYLRMYTFFTGGFNAFYSLGTNVTSSGIVVHAVGYNTFQQIAKFGEDFGAGVFDYVKCRLFDYVNNGVNDSFISDYRYNGQAGFNSSGSGQYTGNFDLGVGLIPHGITDITFTAGVNLVAGSSIEVYGIY